MQVNMLTTVFKRYVILIMIFCCGILSFSVLVCPSPCETLTPVSPRNTDKGSCNSSTPVTMSCLLEMFYLSYNIKPAAETCVEFMCTVEKLPATIGSIHTIRTRRGESLEGSAKAYGS